VSVCPFSVDDDDDESEKKERESVGGAQIIALLQMLLYSISRKVAQEWTHFSPHTKKEEPRNQSSTTFSLYRARTQDDDWL